MNIVVECYGLANRAIWQEAVETKLRKLQDLVAIAGARVRLEHQSEMAPGFRVFTHLEVPGPDFHAEASDHTLLAALGKVMKSLEKQIRSRQGRQLERWKTKVRLGLNPARRLSGLFGARA